jgi:cold shock protein
MVVELGAGWRVMLRCDRPSPRLDPIWSKFMAVGTVKWFNPQKGFGFIQPQDGGKDVFVHISAVEQAGLSTLNDGQQISFDLEQGRQGKTSAVNIKAA